MLRNFMIFSFIAQIFFFNLSARELPKIMLENHIIFCQKDIQEPTKVISDFIKSRLSINNDSERTSIINVYSEGLLKKYIYTILQKHKETIYKEKSKNIRTNEDKTTQYFFYVIVETNENKAVENRLVYADISIKIKKYKYLQKEIINTLSDSKYSITNDKNSARYIIKVEIADILKTNAP